MSGDLPPELVTYFQTREKQRNADTDERLAQLTPRERSLVRDAVVMGYVQGRMHPQDEPHPKDAPVFRGVVYACLVQGHLYPVLSGRADQYTDPEVTSNG